MPNKIIGPIVTSYIGYAFLNRMPIQKEKRDDAVKKANHVNDLHFQIVQNLAKITNLLEEFIKKLPSKVGAGSIPTEVKKLIRDVENEIKHTEDFFMKIKERHKDTPFQTPNQDQLVNSIKVKRHLNILKEDAMPKIKDFVIISLMLTCAVVVDSGLIKNVVVLHVIDAIPLLLLLASFVAQTFFYKGRKEEKYIGSEIKTIEEKVENKNSSVLYLVDKAVRILNLIPEGTEEPRGAIEIMLDKIRKLKTKIRSF